MVKHAAERPKHQKVYDRLVAILTEGDYKVGDRLPSERDFASELNVNVLTVRRAFRDLIAADFVTKRVGSGTYLNRIITDNWHDHAVNLVIDSSCIAPVQKMFERIGRPVADRHDRECRIVHTSRANARELVRSCIQYRQPTIFCGTLPNYREFREDIAAAPELFVSAGALNSGVEIPSVIGSDAVGIDMLMTYLQKLGHKRIALACVRAETGPDRVSSSSILAIQKAAWMSRLGRHYDPSLYCAVDVQRFGDDQIVAAYETMKAALPDLRSTAVICATDEIMFGLAAALREHGLRIPRDVSLVSIGNTDLSRFTDPPVTGVDLNLKGHLDEAFSMLFHNLEHPDRMEMLRPVKPILIERSSAAKVKTDKHIQNRRQSK